MWSVSSILTGFLSFMQEESSAVGSIKRSAAERRRLAARSLAFNVRDAKFRELFPHLVKLHEQRNRLASTADSADPMSSGNDADQQHRRPATRMYLSLVLGLFTVLALLVWGFAGV